jgi:hypothetical protein
MFFSFKCRANRPQCWEECLQQKNGSSPVWVHWGLFLIDWYRSIFILHCRPWSSHFCWTPPHFQPWKELNQAHSHQGIWEAESNRPSWSSSLCHLRAWPLWKVSAYLYVRWAYSKQCQTALECWWSTIYDKDELTCAEVLGNIFGRSL